MKPQEETTEAPCEDTPPANGDRRVWVDTTNHTVPMVCWGYDRDHLVLSPTRAADLGRAFLTAAQQALRIGEDL